MRTARRHDQNRAELAEQAHRLELLLGVVAWLEIEEGVGGVGGVGGDKKGMTIRGGIARCDGSDDAAGTGPVIDGDGRAVEGSRQRLCKAAAREVGCAARCRRHDDADRPIRPACLRPGCRHCAQRCQCSHAH